MHRYVSIDPKVCACLIMCRDYFIEIFTAHHIIHLADNYLVFGQYLKYQTDCHWLTRKTSVEESFEALCPRQALNDLVHLRLIDHVQQDAEYELAI